MDLKSEKYGALEAKVKRTVYLNNLSPQVTKEVIECALDPYGTVTKIWFIPNYTEPSISSCSALVEMENSKHAANVIEVVTGYPFMILGMPRPVRARLAEAEMFRSWPVNKPARKIKLHWLDRGDRGFEAATKLKKMARKHQNEAAYLMELQLEAEEKLSETQAETFKTAYKKHQWMEMLSERSVERLLLLGDKARYKKAAHNIKAKANAKRD